MTRAIALAGLLLLVGCSEFEKIGSDGSSTFFCGLFCSPGTSGARAGARIANDTLAAAQERRDTAKAERDAAVAKERDLDTRIATAVNQQDAIARLAGGIRTGVIKEPDKGAIQAIVRASGDQPLTAEQMGALHGFLTKYSL